MVWYDLSMKKVLKISLIVIAILVASFAVFYVVSRSIVVQECGTTCDCIYNPSEMCNLVGCAKITLWDDLMCKLSHLFATI